MTPKRVRAVERIDAGFIAASVMRRDRSATTNKPAIPRQIAVSSANAVAWWASAENTATR